MKTMIGLLAILAILMFAGCTDKSETLTEVKMHELNVPQNFNYETVSEVTLQLQGEYRLPVTVLNTAGIELYKGMMSPANGLSTKLSLPNGTRELVLRYHIKEVKLPVNGSNLSYTFTQ